MNNEDGKGNDIKIVITIKPELIKQESVGYEFVYHNIY